MTVYAIADEPSSIEDDSTRCWVGILRLLRETNKRLFTSRAYTRQIINNGEYMGILEGLQIAQRDWRKSFNNALCKFDARWSLRL